MKVADELKGWSIKDGEYPHVTGLADAVSATYNAIFGKSGSKWMWRIVSGLTYPFKSPWGDVGDVVIAERVKQQEYIMIYEGTQNTKPTKNGICILHPTRCEITEELNGTYELVMEHPIDESGVYQEIFEGRMVYADGQLFPIYRIQTKFTGNVGTLVVYAKHVFYLMANWWLPENAALSQGNCNTSIAHAMLSVKKGRKTYAGTGDVGDIVEFNFSGSSDLKITQNGNDTYRKYLNQEGCTFVDYIMGSRSDSLLNAYKGELYRNNFDYAINSPMKSSKKDAFQLRVGLNIIGIERDIDYTDVVTWLYAQSNFGDDIWWQADTFSAGIFHSDVVRSVTLQYDAASYDKQTFYDDAKAILDGMSYPKVKYTVNLAEIANNPDYATFKNVNQLQVGDSGRIFDERLNLDMEFRVTRTVKDKITNEIKSVTFEDAKTRRISYGGAMGKAQNAVDKEIDKDQRQQLADSVNVWEDLQPYTWGYVTKCTWGDFSDLEPDLPDIEPYPLPETGYTEYKVGRNAGTPFATHIKMQNGFKASITCALGENVGGSLTWFSYGDGNSAGGQPFKIVYDNRKYFVKCGNSSIDGSGDSSSPHTYAKMTFRIEVNDKITVTSTLLRWIGSFDYSPPLSKTITLEEDISTVTDSTGNGFTIGVPYRIESMKINNGRFIPVMDDKTREYWFYNTGTGEFINPGEGFNCEANEIR